MLCSDDRLRFGVCWYPDHWPRARWKEDIRLMLDAGLECVRIGEGSWTLMEPVPGRLDWSFLDEVLGECEQAGLGVILGTPTYAPPAWLEANHPEIVARRQDGTPWYRHSRRCYDYTQPAYVRACDAIVAAMARRYATDSRVWAWQVDNEMWCHLGELWGESARRAFQVWLAKRYETIERLNDGWGLSFWSNQLSQFNQADLPGPTPAYQNHHQCADYRHFLSDLALAFLGRQMAHIRAANPHAVVLHNCPFGPLDRAALLEQLDVYGHDHYPRFAPTAEERPAMGLNYGRFRAYARRLWVVEQQASQVGQTSYRLPTAPPGDLSVAALQSIAHGCNLLAWFRWRSFPAAQETNWGGLLPHWGKPGRHYEEARELVRKLAPHAAQIARTRPVVDVARLASYRQSVGAEVEPWIGEHIGSIETGRRALRRLGLNEDTLRPVDLGARGEYSVALLPLALALDSDEVSALEAWVRAGGVLVVGPLAGHRGPELQGPSVHEPPGLLAALTGTRNAETTTLEAPARLRPVCAHDVDSLVATSYAELIDIEGVDCEPLAVYTDTWFAGRNAIVGRPLGAGRVVHCGVSLSDSVLHWLWSSSLLPRPPSVVALSSDAAEVLSRKGDGVALHFVLNHGAEPVECELSGSTNQLTSLLSDEPMPRRFTLPPHGYEVLRQ
jgi:beta-galactosidase